MNEPEAIRIPTAGDAIEKAEQLLIAGRSDLAERAAREGLAAHPTNAVLRVVLGRALLDQERRADAEEEFRQALAADPLSTYARYFAGVAAMKAGRHREAEGVMLEGLSLDPEHAPLYHLYAVLLHKTGHDGKAERAIRHALGLDPDNATYHATLSRILSSLGSRGAEHAGRRGLALAPGDDYPHRSLGLAYLRSGRPFAARRHLREALRLDPADPDLEEAFLEADLCCRWIYLPMYATSLLVRRLPGNQFALWGILVLFLMSGPALGVPEDVLGPIAYGYLAFCIYTWIARPLGRAWTRILPPR